MKIKIAGMKLESIDVAQLKPMQGNLKHLTEKNYEKLKKSFAEKGLFVPMFVWRRGDGDYAIMDGHGRERLFTKEGASFVGEDGVETTKVPCVVIEAADERDAKEKLLIITSQFQTITQEGLDEFAFDLGSSIHETINFDAIFSGFDAKEIEPPDLAGGGKGEYQQMTFTLHDEQVEQVKEAIAKAIEAGAGESPVNENKNGNALAFIAQGFVNGRC